MPLTWRNAAVAHGHLILYLYMAYLTRRPDTQRTRLLLLPIIIVTSLRFSTQYRLNSPLWGWYNWVRGLVALTVIAHSIYFAILPEGTLKVGEKSLRPPAARSRPKGDVAMPSSNGQSAILPPWLYDALETGLATRGIGWQFSQGVHVPKARRSSERKEYLKSTIASITGAYLFIDFVDSCFAILPGITPTGGTIYFPQLPPILRYTVSTLLHTIVGLVVIVGLSMCYDIMSLVGVGLFKYSPDMWPPFHDEPWRVSSLHEFWSKRWHQALRHTFLVYGGYPVKWLAGDIGMLFGTFIASGLFHELGLYLGAGAPMDLKVILVFVAQPFGILVEKCYRNYAGKRMAGWTGFIWAAIFVLGIGQICTDSWVGRGIGGQIIAPPALSPARRMFIPLLQKLV